MSVSVTFRFESSSIATITAILSGTNQYKSSSKTVTFTVTKASCLLTTFNINNQVFSYQKFTPILPTITAGNGIIKYVSNANTAQVDPVTGEITMLKAGNGVITAIISETPQYNSTFITSTFIIGKATSS